MDRNQVQTAGNRGQDTSGLPVAAGNRHLAEGTAAEVPSWELNAADLRRMKGNLADLAAADLMRF